MKPQTKIVLYISGAIFFLMMAIYSLINQWKEWVVLFGLLCVLSFYKWYWIMKK